MVPILLPTCGLCYGNAASSSLPPTIQPAVRRDSHSLQLSKHRSTPARKATEELIVCLPNARHDEWNVPSKLSELDQLSREKLLKVCRLSSVICRSIKLSRFLLRCDMYNQPQRQQHPYAHTNGMNSRSRSVPEGLAQPNGDIHWNYNRTIGHGFHRTPSRQPLQVLEQITTSVWPKMSFQNLFICFCVYVVEGIVAVVSWNDSLAWAPRCWFRS